MTQRMFRIYILLTLGFAASQTILPAQERHELEGIWSVSVTVTNCQTDAPTRTVASLQQFRPGASMIETANTASSPHLASSSTMTRTANSSRPVASRTPLPA
jgi:hypothetical protein